MSEEVKEVVEVEPVKTISAKVIISDDDDPTQTEEFGITCKIKHEGAKDAMSLFASEVVQRGRRIIDQGGVKEYWEAKRAKLESERKDI